jgi:hypothetical protein
MDVELLAAEPVGPRPQGIGSTFRVLHKLGAEHTGVELVGGVPVVDVNHCVVKFRSIHRIQSARFGR